MSSSKKLRRILKRFARAHIDLAVLGSDLTTLENGVYRKAKGLRRRAPVDLIRFPTDADRRFIDSQGRIDVRLGDLEWQRISGS